MWFKVFKTPILGENVSFGNECDFTLPYKVTIFDIPYAVLKLPVNMWFGF